MLQQLKTDCKDCDLNYWVKGPQLTILPRGIITGCNDDWKHRVMKRGREGWGRRRGDREEGGGGRGRGREGGGEWQKGERSGGEGDQIRNA